MSEPTRSRELTETVSNIVASKPFFAYLLYDQFELVERGDIPTAATDGKRIYVGPWFRDLPLKQRVFVLCHEIYHCVFDHIRRAQLYREREFGPDLKPFNPQRWNAAGDYYINFLLTADKVGEMPPEGLLDHYICHSPDDLVDDIYLKLPEEQGDDNFDEHMTEPAEDAPSPRALKQAVVAAVENVKAVGKLSGNLQRAVDRLLNPPERWRDLFRDLMTASVGKDDTSWARPHRRRLALPPHVPYPGTQGFAMGTLVLAIDTSGSIGQAELTAFFTEVQGVIEQVRPRELWLAWWDTQCVMQRLESVEELDVDELRPTGGGGTSYRCVEPAIADEYIEPECVVALTDGHVDWPESFPWMHITLSTTDRSAPFGHTVRMDLTKDYA